MGRSGRTLVQGAIPKLRESWGLDFVIANGENATNGRGLSKAHASVLIACGIDCVTLGDHAFDQRNLAPYITQNNAILPPVNLTIEAPGKGVHVFSLKCGRKIMVASILGTVFIKMPASNPFESAEHILKTYPLGKDINASLIDFHAEATSEKMAMGHLCDGRASVVVGTHTHVPTADIMILRGGTAYQSDAGMCGDYDSVIGMQKGEPLHRFMTGKSKAHFEPAVGEATLCGLFVETDDKTGKAQKAFPVRLGGNLMPSQPSFV